MIEHEPGGAARQRRAVIGILIFATLFLPLLVSLGIWQLNRAEQKEQLQQSLEQRKALPPLTVDEIAQAGPQARYRQLKIVGEFSTQYQWLLDNRTHQGRFGYEVITALRVEPQGHWILVNRGWVEASPRRELLPEIPIPAGRVELLGQLDRVGASHLVLKTPVQEPGWPKRVQFLELEQAEADARQSFLPWQLRLPETAPGAFVPIHQAVSMGPEKHLGYAVQWFGLALVLLIGSILALTRIRKESL